MQRKPKKMLNESQAKTIEELENLKKQVELLESHRTVDFVTPKQYNDSARRIMVQLEEIEHQFGIYEDNSLNKKFKDAERELDLIEKMLIKMAIMFDEENYNLAIQLALDGVFRELKDGTDKKD